MTKDEILELAKQSKIVPYLVLQSDAEYLARFERFSNLIESAVIKRLSAGAGEPFTTVCSWKHGDIEMITDSPPCDGDYTVIDCYTQEQVAAAVAAEREACAEVCEGRSTPGTGSVAILNGAADAIRNRSAS